MVANREPCEPTVKALFDSAFTVFSLSFQCTARTVNHVNPLWVSRTSLRARLIQFSKLPPMGSHAFTPATTVNEIKVFSVKALGSPGRRFGRSHPSSRGRAHDPRPPPLNPTKQVSKRLCPEGHVKRDARGASGMPDKCYQP